MEAQTTRVLTVRRSPGPEGGEPPHAGRPPGREPDAVYRRRRLIAAAVGGILFFLVIVLIVSAGGSDPEPKSTPADLGVGATDTMIFPLDEGGVVTIGEREAPVIEVPVEGAAIDLLPGQDYTWQQYDWKHTISNHGTRKLVEALENEDGFEDDGVGKCCHELSPL